ncbi:MAG: hypothetical protein NVS1B10_01340 [Candidatus Saccharimonadales bacterium]
MTELRTVEDLRFQEEIIAREIYRHYSPELLKELAEITIERVFLEEDL